jgi:hypothetical protein
VRTIPGRRTGSSRALEGHLLLVLALAAPMLCFGQDAGSAGASTPDSNTPAATAPTAGAPAVGAPAAIVPGGFLPDTMSGLNGADTTGLTPLPAEFTNYGLSAGLGETDNVNLSPTHPKTQTLSSVNAFFDFIRSGSHLDLNAVGNFGDTDYLEGAYSNQVLGRFDGLADLTAWDHHFKWLVRDDYGDQQIDVLQSLTPVNLQRVNVFSTGPDLTLQPTTTSFVELEGIYSRNSWQDSPFSGNTVSGTATVGHQISPTSTISLVGQIEEERFDNTTVNADYQVREFYGHYALDITRTRLDLQAGVAQANDRGPWSTTPLVRVSASRSVSPFSTLSVAGGRDYTNAMGSFASLAGGTTGGIPVGAATQTTGNALHTYGDVTGEYRRQRTSISLTAEWQRNNYDVQSKFNYVSSDLALSLRRQITPRLSADVMATVDRSQYGNQGFTNDYGTVGTGLIYRPGTWFVIYGRYDHQFRTSSGLAHDLGYDENRIFVMFGYYPHSSGTGLPKEMGGGNGFY